MEIKELNSETVNAWFDFFDNRAFLDHEEWKGCYCTAFYYPKPEEYKNVSNKRREYANWLIETKRMCGYLAFEEGSVIGWVNTNNKECFPRLKSITNFEEKVLSIVCFNIEKEKRGNGIANKLLERVIEDAPIQGYKIIESYPKKRAQSEYGKWNGPYEMYKKNGFEEYEIGKVKVLRRYL